MRYNLEGDNIMLHIIAVLANVLIDQLAGAVFGEPRLAVDSCYTFPFGPISPKAYKKWGCHVGIQGSTGHFLLRHESNQAQ
jgi:hypothetical protein